MILLNKSLLATGIQCTLNMLLKVPLKIGVNNIIMFLTKTCGDSLFGSQHWVIYNRIHMLDSVVLKQQKRKDLFILDKKYDIVKQNFENRINGD